MCWFDLNTASRGRSAVPDTYGVPGESACAATPSTLGTLPQCQSWRNCSREGPLQGPCCARQPGPPRAAAAACRPRRKHAGGSRGYATLQQAAALCTRRCAGQRGVRTPSCEWKGVASLACLRLPRRWAALAGAAPPQAPSRVAAAWRQSREAVPPAPSSSRSEQAELAAFSRRRLQHRPCFFSGHQKSFHPVIFPEQSGLRGANIGLTPTVWRRTRALLRHTVGAVPPPRFSCGKT